MSLSSNELLARSNRKPELFVEIFERHGQAVHSYLARRVGAQQAEDLFSEVWLRAYKARATYDKSRGDALPWIYGVARNTLRAHWRGGKAGAPGPASMIGGPGSRQSDPAAGQAEGADPGYDPWPDVDRELDATRLSPALRRAVADLEAPEREVLLLSVWEQLAPKEIAEVLGTPAGTVRWRLHKARTALQNTNLFPVATTQEIRQ